MSIQLKLRRGTTAQHSTFTGASGEVTVDTDKKTLVVHDGATAGGVPLATAASVTSGLAGKQPLASELTAIAATGNAMFKNRIINGACAINQRVSSLSTNNSKGYFVDRMWGFSGTATACTYSQISSTSLSGFPYAMRAQRTAGNTGTASIFLGQIVESNNLQDLQGQSVTLSFFARAGANFSASSSTLTVYLRTGTVADQGLNLLVSGWTGASTQSSTVTLTTDWQQFSKTFTVPSDAQELSFFVGAVPTGTAGSNDYYDITGVQLEKGSTATSFDYRPYGTELALCQRYYQKGYFWGSGNGDLTNLYFQAVNLPVAMRAQPSVTNDADSSGIVANGNLYNLTAGSANIPNSWWYGASGYISVTTNAQITRWTTASGRIANLQLSAEL